MFTRCFVNNVYTLNLLVKQAKVDDIGIDTAGFMFLQSIGCLTLLLCKGHSYNTGVQLLGRCKKSWLQLVLKLLSNSTSLMSLARSGSQWPGSQLSKGAEQRFVEPVSLRGVSPQILMADGKNNQLMRMAKCIFSILCSSDWDFLCCLCWWCWQLSGLRTINPACKMSPGRRGDMTHMTSHDTDDMSILSHEFPHDPSSGNSVWADFTTLSDGIFCWFHVYPS